jgi:hypothetical protein
MYAESKIIGEINIGGNVLLSLGKTVFNDVPSNSILK